jgi:hypothetical protein
LECEGAAADLPRRSVINEGKPTMGYSDTLTVPYPIPMGIGKRASSDFWTRRRSYLKAASYAALCLIGLAIGPVLFVGMDHDLVVRWSNGILDLVGR